MRILITGAKGMLAAELIKTAAQTDELILTDVAELDITDLEFTLEFIKKNQPNLVINCAAYTAVDNAETEIELSYKINELGAKNLMMACNAVSAKLVHISTDFVFDREQEILLNENDEKNPKSIYGKSKLAGEKAIETAAEKNTNWLIVRTAWLYGKNGKNFPDTMINLAKEKTELKVVNDQKGSPTYAYDLAKALWILIEKKAAGYFHFSNTDVCSWYDFAVETINIAREIGLLPKNNQTKVFPCTTQEFPRPAKRPKFSAMNTKKIAELTKIQPRNWKLALREYLLEKITN